MRAINYFVLTQTKNEYPAMVADSFEKGMVYPAPHFYVFRMDDNDESEDYKVLKPRPLSQRCGTVRDSRLNNNGIGVMIFNPSGKKLNPKLEQTIASIIRNTAEDLGIIDYQIVTDEVDGESFVDTIYINALVGSTPSMFTKRI